MGLMREGASSVRATVIHGAGDVRVEDVPDPALREPTLPGGYREMAGREALKVMVRP